MNSDLNIVSYNILQPNFPHGWWVPKYYDPRQSAEYCQWDYRRRKLRSQLLEYAADVLALQETSRTTFEEDFEYLFEEYQGLCHRRDRIACATFWRKDRFELVAEYHRDRCLIVLLKDGENGLLAIANCHLSAGAKPRRRFQQIYGACEQLRKIKARWPVKDFIILGDFNEVPKEAAIYELLNNGILLPEFRDEKYPDIQITSKVKRQELGVFTDCYMEDRHCTMWVRNVLESMRGEKGWRRDFLEALSTLFDCYAKEAFLTEDEQEAWILDINGEMRGSEVDKLHHLSTEAGLSRAGFIELHLQEIQEGKHWAVHYYLLRKGIELTTPEPSYHAFCLDQFWIHTERFELVDSIPSPSIEEQSRVVAGDFPPNSWHPSDHFPLRLCFKTRPTAQY